MQAVLAGPEQDLWPGQWNQEMDQPHTTGEPPKQESQKESSAPIKLDLTHYEKTAGPREHSHAPILDGNVERQTLHTNSALDSSMSPKPEKGLSHGSDCQDRRK